MGFPEKQFSHGLLAHDLGWVPGDVSREICKPVQHREITLMALFFRSSLIVRSQSCDELKIGSRFPSVLILKSSKFTGT